MESFPLKMVPPSPLRQGRKSLWFKRSHHISCVKDPLPINKHLVKKKKKKTDIPHKNLTAARREGPCAADFVFFKCTIKHRGHGACTPTPSSAGPMCQKSHPGEGTPRGNTCVDSKAPLSTYPSTRHSEQLKCCKPALEGHRARSHAFLSHLVNGI